MQFFLRLKHWQLFIITFGIPFILQMILMCSMVICVAGSHNPNPETFLSFFWLFPIIMLLFMGSLFCWIWQVSINLQTGIPEYLRMKTTMFKIFFFIPLIYILFIFTVFGYIFTHLVGYDQAPAKVVFTLLLIVPVHLFSMFCIFYCIYFTARTLKTVELQRPVIVSDYIGEFFLIWFFFIGVWILQPRVNKFIAENDII